MEHRTRPRMISILAALLIVPALAMSAAEAAGWWQPRPGTSWDIWLSRVPTPKTAPAVEAIDLDLFDVGPETIAEFRRRGVRVICYFSAGSFEEWRPDADRYQPADLGAPLAGWEGEWWVDVRSANVRQIVADRLILATEKGCEAVDPDNVDGYANDNGLGLTEADQLDFNRYVAAAAHERGLAVGLKNALPLVPALVADFDFAINEQCFQYRECGALRPFVAAGKAVFQIEYGKMARARRICPKANRLGFDSLVKRRDLGPWRIACDRFA